MSKSGLKFPAGFLWGSAISAHQTEGNNTNSDWWVWEKSPQRTADLKQKGKNPEDYVSGQACDFYNRYEQDFDLLKELNQNAFRLSIEWARIEPREGVFDEKEIEHYRQVLLSLKDRGIKTFVTLHHYTNPLWFADRGGFVRSENVNDFVRYIRFAAGRLHPYVDFWLTINEPQIYADEAFLFGKWPPQHKNLGDMVRVCRNFIKAHNSAYEELKGYGKPVSMAFHMADLEPANFLSGLTTEVGRYFFNFYILNRVIDRCDFIGLNYYGHNHITLFGRRMKSLSNHQISDLGWGIHPEGIERVLFSLKKYKKPIYITENGLADAGDTRRERFIRDHLFYIHRAIENGADVRGYLHWSLLDNFEWDHGFPSRFGLVEVDHKTGKRKIRKSALAYSKICKNNAL